MEPNTTRNYKDTVFSSLFYSCKDAVENAKDLYKALTGITVQHAILWTGNGSVLSNISLPSIRICR